MQSKAKQNKQVRSVAGHLLSFNERCHHTMAYSTASLPVFKNTFANATAAYESFCRSRHRVS